MFTKAELSNISMLVNEVFGSGKVTAVPDATVLLQLQIKAERLRDELHQQELKAAQVAHKEEEGGQDV